MKFAKKYYLIDPQHYQTISNSTKTCNSNGKDLFTHPDAKVAKEESQNMRNISSSEELSDYEKVLQHSEALQRYLNHFNRAFTVPKKIATIGNEVRTEAVADQTVQEDKPQVVESKIPVEEKPTFSTEKILSSFKDTAQKETALALLNELETSSNVTWNKLTGKVNIDGTQLRGTDITKLLKDTVIKKGKQSASKSAIKFREALDNLELQRNLSKRRKQIGYGKKIKIDKRLLREWYEI